MHACLMHACRKLTKHHLRQVQFLPRDMRGIVEREEKQIPPVGATIRLCSKQDQRVKRMHHDPIPEKKDERELGRREYRQRWIVYPRTSE
jgi:hypothetical protein